MQFTVSLMKYLKLAVISSKGIIHKILVKISSSNPEGIYILGSV